MNRKMSDIIQHNKSELTPRIGLLTSYKSQLRLQNSLISFTELAKYVEIRKLISLLIAAILLG